MRKTASPKADEFRSNIAPKGRRHVAWGASARTTASQLLPSPNGAKAALSGTPAFATSGLRREFGSPRFLGLAPQATCLRPFGATSVCLVFLAFLAALPARAWDVSGSATPGDFQAFHRRFSSDAYFFPRHRAAPLGLLGFEVYADATYDSKFDDEPFVRTAIDGDLTGGFLSVARVGARKGLPGGIDLGLSYGRALGGDVKLVSGELQYAIAKGGLLSPALSVRVTGTRTTGSHTYDLNQYGAELLFSKGFTVLTPYVGAGFVRSKGTLDSTVGAALEDTTTRSVVYAGLTLNLLLPKITFEVEKADVVQGAVRVGFGI
jgi:hypothetical protein